MKSVKSFLIRELSRFCFQKPRRNCTVSLESSKFLIPTNSRHQYVPTSWFSTPCQFWLGHRQDWVVLTSVSHLLSGHAPFHVNSHGWCADWPSQSWAACYSYLPSCIQACAAGGPTLLIVLFSWQTTLVATCPKRKKGVEATVHSPVQSPTLPPRELPLMKILQSGQQNYLLKNTWKAQLKVILVYHQLSGLLVLEKGCTAQISFRQILLELQQDCVEM